MKKNGIELSHNDITETEWKQKSHSKDRINAKKKKLCTVTLSSEQMKMSTLFHSREETNVILAFLFTSLKQ